MDLATLSQVTPLYLIFTLKKTNFKNMKRSAPILFSFAFFMLFFTNYSSASINVSIDTPRGFWSDGSTWQTGIVPNNSNCYDTILINTPVYIGSQISVNTCGAIVFIVEDTLIFKSGFKLDLPAGSAFIVRDSGYVYPEGNGNSNQIFIGNTEYWRSSDGPLHGNVYLDVSYISIEVSHSDGMTYLEWRTATETNNDYFIVQESLNGTDFEEVARIRGAGNSHKEQQYRFELPRILDQVYFYRLAQVDFDGSTELSDILVLDPSQYNSIDVKLWADGGKLHINLSDIYLPDDLKLYLIDATGKVVLSSLFNNEVHSEFDITQFMPGFYYCMISTPNEVLATRTLSVSRP